MSEFIQFVDDSQQTRENKNFWKILIVDDDEDVQKLTQLVLKDLVFDEKKIQIISAYSKEEAIDILKKEPEIALAIIDVVMEDKTAGLDLVKYIREELKNRKIRLIIRTGQPGYAPRKDVILNYDINDYREKTELSTEMMVGVVITALRSYRELMISEQQKVFSETLLDLYSNYDKTKDITSLIIEAIKRFCVSVKNLHIEASAIVISKDGRVSKIGPNPPKYPITNFSDTENISWLNGKSLLVQFKEKNRRVAMALIKFSENLSERLKDVIKTFFLELTNIVNAIALERLFSRTMYQMIFVLAELIEHRSLETGEHIKRVAEVSEIIAKSLGYDDETSDKIKLAAMLHDVGKIGIPDNILNKPGKLTDEEYETMKRHTVIGYKILSHYDNELFKMTATIALNHHENWDGGGYPQRLQGEEIPIEARIVTVADNYDALLSDRIYRPAWPEERVLNYIKTMSGIKFDPKIVKVFFENYQKIKEVYK